MSGRGAPMIVAGCGRGQCAVAGRSGASKQACRTAFAPSPDGCPSGPSGHVAVAIGGDEGLIVGDVRALAGDAVVAPDPLSEIDELAPVGAKRERGVLETGRDRLAA